MPPQSALQEPDYNAAQAYTPENIQVYRGRERIRMRPGMYIGDTGQRGLHYLLYQLVANSVEEFRAGFGARIDVDLLHDGGCRVRDEGRGIPVGVRADEEPSTLEIIFTRRENGLHRLGYLKVVNALSARLEVEVERDGKRWQTAFERGAMTEQLRAVRNTARTGTTITFWPDPFIFRSDPRFAFDTLAERFRALAACNRGLAFALADQRGTPPRGETIHYREGTVDFLRFLDIDRLPVHSGIFCCRAQGVVPCEVAFRWTASPDELLRSYVNSYFTSEEGTHVTGFRHAVTRTLLDYARTTGLLDSGETPCGDDCRAGLTAVVAVDVAEPHYDGATKNHLNNPEVEGHVRTAVSPRFAEFLHQHPDDALAIWHRVLAARDARLAQAAAKRRRAKK
jgi:DNA gyrase subunit B